VRDVASKDDEGEIARIFREESGQSVATLIRLFGDIDVAEDAVQEAFAVALREWLRDGLPLNPGAGSRRPPATVLSTGCAASRVNSNFSARWR
jgi:hypothetical protein